MCVCVCVRVCSVCMYDYGRMAPAGLSSLICVPVFKCLPREVRAGSGEEGKSTLVGCGKETEQESINRKGEEWKREGGVQMRGMVV